MKNPYNSQPFEYKLSIPPSKVMEIISTFTEERGLKSVFNSPQRKYTEFWRKLNGNDIFKITRKETARGYGNSFAPWLVGWVIPNSGGSTVKVFFDVDETVSIIIRISSYMLTFFTIVIACFFIIGAIAGNLTNERWIGLFFITGFWVFNFGLTRLGYYLGQRDTTVLTEFIERVFSSYRIS